MYDATLSSFADLIAAKSAYAKRSPIGFFVSSALAGAYVGLGIILIFSLGDTVPPEWRKLVMGVSFGIALTLVAVAGAELFTGYMMFGTIGVAKRRISAGTLGRLGATTWVANLAGSAALAGLFALGGGGGLLRTDSLVQTIATAKMNAPAIELFARAVLCNWLVCLALWMGARVKDDTAKCIVIFWCLFAFIASGFEHSVANMTLLSIALIGQHPETVSLAGMAHNLVWVTLGNIVGGAGFVAGAYLVANGAAERPSEEARAKAVEAIVPAE